jgi:hypothetical protein
MTAHDHLQVHVNDELVLDAGTCVQVSGPNGPELLIRPPEATLFHQVLAYLRLRGCIHRVLATTLVQQEEGRLAKLAPCKDI